jgi:hypothetical protein
MLKRLRQLLLFSAVVTASLTTVFLTWQLSAVREEGMYKPRRCLGWKATTGCHLLG